jgi:hypothetical protein
MRRSHGEVKTVGGKRTPSPEYRTWQSVKNRCFNPRSRDYSHYGGRGVTMHPAWVSDFAAFLADVGRRPCDGMTLDRVDGDGNYEPGNVRWVDRLEQARNRKYASVRAWEVAAELGVSQAYVYHMMWQVRKKDAGDTRWFQLSAEREAVVRRYMEAKCK